MLEAFREPRDHALDHAVALFGVMSFAAAMSAALGPAPTCGGRIDPRQRFTHEAAHCAGRRVSEQRLPGRRGFPGASILPGKNSGISRSHVARIKRHRAVEGLLGILGHAPVGGPGQ